jgi:hypothetical protein
VGSNPQRLVEPLGARWLKDSNYKGNANSVALFPELHWRIFPGHPRPRPHESETLSSWLSRFSRSNGLSELDLARIIFVGASPKLICDWDVLQTGALTRCLEKCAGIASGELVRQLGFSNGKSLACSSTASEWYHDWRLEPGLQWLPLPLRRRQVCSGCISEVPIYRFDWCFAFAVMCPKHGSDLQVSCESCSENLSSKDDDAGVIEAKMASCASCKRRGRIARSKMSSSCGVDDGLLLKFQEYLASLARQARLGCTLSSRLLLGVRRFIDVCELYRNALPPSVWLQCFTSYPFRDAISCSAFHTKTVAERARMLLWLAIIREKNGAAFNDALSQLSQVQLLTPEYKPESPFIEEMFRIASHYYRQPKMMVDINRGEPQYALAMNSFVEVMRVASGTPA